MESFVKGTFVFCRHLCVSFTNLSHVLLKKDVDKYKCMGSIGQIKPFDKSDTSAFFNILTSNFSNLI